jgi:pyruvate/2-oxoglutarate dehydrogenase complex dihydrolipoamide acyltransferase (E2) component
MLRASTERRDSGQPLPTQDKSRTWGVSSSQQNDNVNKSKSNHKRKASAQRKVTGTSQPNTNTTPVSRRHKVLASLLVSFLATSAVAIEIDAADEKTVESANKASSTPLPPPPPKVHTRSSSGVKPSEIRRTRWNRFKYEMGLKMKSGNKGKQRRQSDLIEEMELIDTRSQKREQEQQQAKRVGTA